jgi:hypothetical protein
LNHKRFTGFNFSPDRHLEKVRFEARIQELVENFPDLAVLVEPLLIGAIAKFW